MTNKIRPEFSAPVPREIPGYIHLCSSIFLQSFKPIIQLIPLFNKTYYVLLFILNIINKNNNNLDMELRGKTSEIGIGKKGESEFICKLAQKTQGLFFCNRPE